MRPCGALPGQLSSAHLCTCNLGLNPRYEHYLELKDAKIWGFGIWEERGGPQSSEKDPRGERRALEERGGRRLSEPSSLEKQR